MSVSLFVSRIFAIPQPKGFCGIKNQQSTATCNNKKNYLSNIIIIMRFSGISLKKGISDAPLNQNENNVWLIFFDCAHNAPRNFL